MAYIPALIGAAELFAVSYMLSVMTLIGLQRAAAVLGALAIYAATIFYISKRHHNAVVTAV